MVHGGEERAKQRGRGASSTDSGFGRGGACSETLTSSHPGRSCTRTDLHHLPPGAGPAGRSANLLSCFGLRVEGLGFRIWGLGIRVLGAGFRVLG